MCPEDSPRFIVDINVGKLAKWLRMIGYDTILFDHRDDKSPDSHRADRE